MAFDATALLSTRTGVGVFASELLRFLAPQPGLELCAYSVTWRGHPRLDSALPDRVPRVAARLPARLMRRTWRAVRVPPLEWFTGEVDVVHGPNYLVPPTRRAAGVVTVHDVGFEHRPPWSTDVAADHRADVRAAVRQGCWVHTPSEFVAREVRSLYNLDAERVVCVPLGVRLHLLGGHPSPGAPYLLALGAMDRRKGLPTLVAAFDMLAAESKDLRLLHAGPTGDDEQALDAAVAASPHRRRIQRLGWVDNATRAALLADAAVVVYPSHYEGFGMVPLEAMLAGRPVVTSPTGAIPETAGDAARYAAAGDAAALASEIKLLLEDDSLAAEMVRRGRERAGAYSWRRTASAMSDLYRRAAAEA